MIKNKLHVYGRPGDVSVPAHMNFAKHMLNRFQSYADHDAIINSDTNESITFRELSQQVVDIALSLTHIGVKKGDVISICSLNEMEFMPVVYGAIAAGATFSANDVTCTGKSLLHRFNIAQPKILFCSPHAYNEHKETIQTVTSIEKVIIFGEAIDEAIGFKDFLTQHASVEDFEVAPVNGTEDLAVILYSSGTTGLPKGIKMTHLNMLLSTFGETDEGNNMLGWRGLAVFEWYSSYGLNTTLYIHRTGATVVYYKGGDTRKCLETIQNLKINILPMTPINLKKILLSKDLPEYNTSSLKLIFGGGTICDESTLAGIRERIPGVPIFLYYGMTEVGSVCSSTKAPCGYRPGSAGCLTKVIVAKIVDMNTGDPLGPSQRGEICIKSPALMQGYIGADYDYLDEEGFFKTGDIGYYDEDEYFYIVDRIKDLIKYNNYHVPPAELETLLEKHPAVREAGVVGAPHETMHELPTAFVVLRPGAQATEQEIIDFVDKHTSHRMRLAGGVRFVEAMPRSAGIKVDRKQLRLMLEQNEFKF